MKIEFEVNIMCSEDADTNNFNNENWDWDVSAWDITREISEIEAYFETKDVRFEKNLQRSNYTLHWSLDGPDITKDELKAIIEGTIIILNRLESSFNSLYHNINDSVVKPQYAFFMQSVTIDNQKYDLSLFDDFNKRNDELQQKF